MSLKVNFFRGSNKIERALNNIMIINKMIMLYFFGIIRNSPLKIKKVQRIGIKLNIRNQTKIIRGKKIRRKKNNNKLGETNRTLTTRISNMRNFSFLSMIMMGCQISNMIQEKMFQQ